MNECTEAKQKEKEEEEEKPAWGKDGEIMSEKAMNTIYREMRRGVGYILADQSGLPRSLVDDKMTLEPYGDIEDYNKFVRLTEPLPFDFDMIVKPK